MDPKEMRQEQVTDLTSEVCCFHQVRPYWFKGEQAVCKFSRSSRLPQSLSEVRWELCCRTLQLGRAEGSGVADHLEPTMVVGTVENLG